MGYAYKHIDDKELSEGLNDGFRTLIKNFLNYRKDNDIYSISKKPNEVGATEMMILKVD